MVVGLKKFEEHFKDFRDCFVIIGGTACSILFSEENLKFRETKDIDVVLILDEINGDFSKAFWEFINMGRYESMEGTGDKVAYYRFTKPQSADFPWQIELFSRKPDVSGFLEDNRIVPIKFEEAKSLSAILLNDDYYACLRSGIRPVVQLNCLEVEYVILFKMKAYLDLSEKKERGEQADLKDIKKHRNDVFKLLQLVPRDKRVTVPSVILEDLRNFIERMRSDPPDMRNLKLGFTLEEALDILEGVYITLAEADGRGHEAKTRPGG